MADLEKQYQDAILRINRSTAQPTTAVSAPAPIQDIGFQQAAARAGTPAPAAAPMAPDTGLTTAEKSIFGTQAQVSTTPVVVPTAASGITNPPAGTVLGYDYIAGKDSTTSTQRRPRIADGNGGFVYGVYELNPGFVSTGQGSTTGAIPGPGGTSGTSEKSLAADTFVNTLALLIGKEEASKDYVKKLYALAAPYYRSGSTVDEAMNLALKEAQLNNAIPEFTKRFRAIKALEDLRRQGVPVEVPTIAQFVKSQEALADVLKIAGLKDLANEDFLNDVMATGKSVSESSSIINDVFNAIDLAPDPVKAEIARTIPFADRTTLAKAILTGEAGIKELEQKRRKAEVTAAAGGAGVSIADAAAQELANAGFTYRTSRPKFEQAKQISQRGTFLTSLTGEAPVTQEQAVGAVFNQAANELDTLGKIEEKERLRFQGRTGAVKLASQARGSAGRF
jgi:hypothetical protein